MKSVRIQGYSGPHFPAFGLNTERYSVFSVRVRENTDQYNPKYGHLLRSVVDWRVIDALAFPQ